MSELGTYHGASTMMRKTLDWKERYAYRHKEEWEGFMSYPVQIDSCAMIYIPSFVNIG
jgi:hypothetical protein